MKRTRKFSDFEYEVLQHLWRMGESSTPELHREVAATRDVKYSTVRTIVDRLEEKRAIKRTAQDGRAVVFRPVVKEQDVAIPMLQRFVDKMFGGDTRPLLSHLLDNETLSADDIAYLEAAIANRKKALRQDD